MLSKRPPKLLTKYKTETILKLQNNMSPSKFLITRQKLSTAFSLPQPRRIPYITVHGKFYQNRLSIKENNANFTLLQLKTATLK